MKDTDGKWDPTKFVELGMLEMAKRHLEYRSNPPIEAYSCPFACLAYAKEESVRVADVVKVFEFGDRTYGSYNWVGEDPSVYLAAMRRHLLLASEGPDERSGLPHLSHAAGNALIVVMLTRSDADVGGSV